MNHRLRHAVRTPSLQEISWLAVIALGSAALSAAFIADANATDLAKSEIVVVNKAGVDSALAIDFGHKFLTAVQVSDALSSRSTVTQGGSSNQANVVQSGRALSITISQDGLLNTVSASQTGQLNSLDLTQRGNGNQAVFNQSGGSQATLSQVGDMHSAVINQSSTAPNISIRQSGVGTVVQTTQY